MTVAALPNYTTFQGNGTTGPFSFLMTFDANSEIIVTQQATGGQPVIIGQANYTLTGAGSSTGGSVTLGTALPVGSVLTITRVLPLAQNLSLPYQGPYSGPTLENAFDRVTKMIQQNIGQTPTPEVYTAGVDASTYGSDLATAVAAIGNGSVTLIVDSPMTVNNSLVVPSNISLVANKPGLLTVASMQTLTINGPFTAGLYQAFAGTGTVAGLKEARPEWFGANTIPGTTDMSAATQAATNAASGNVIFSATTYKIAGVTYTGTVNWRGVAGETTTLSDSTILTVTNGTNSVVKDCNLMNITAPYQVTRDWGTWATHSLAYSNTTGYQPTVNDGAIWSGLTTAQQNQDIGPRIRFTGAATNVVVSGITGRFVTIIMEGTSSSVAKDCNFKAGKGTYGGIVFWNVSPFTAGAKNSAINNTVYESSFSGITFANNYDPMAHGNYVYNCGESGIKTYQSGAGYACYNSKIENNNTQFCYYDGIDAQATYGSYDPTFDSRNSVQNNNSYGNGQTGITINGSNNTVTGNVVRANGVTGLRASSTNNSLIANNYSMDNNKANVVSGEHQILVTGVGNIIEGNTVNRGSATQGYDYYIDLASIWGRNFETSGSSIYLGAPVILKGMTDYIYTPGGGVVVITSDLNAITQSGFYYTTSSTNKPGSNWYYVEHYNVDSTTALQIANQFNAVTKYRRQKTNSTWGSWTSF